MKFKQIVVSFCLLMVSAPVMAQVEVDTNSLFAKAKLLVDKNVVHGVDTNYIKAPEYPWQVSVRTKVTQTELQIHSSIDGESIYDGEFFDPTFKATGNLDTDPRFRTDVSTSLGVKVGYKGISASYSFNVSGLKGRNLTLRSVGNWYSLNLRWHKFKMDTPTTHFAGQMYVRDDKDSPWPEEALPWSFTADIPLDAAMRINTLMFDGFYIFNSKRFSYAAAYNQKTYQVRSAGSFIAGLTAYYADFNYRNSRNADFILMMDDISRLRQYQVSIGAGYAYNFVPAKGWLISAMFMPTISLLNRTKVNLCTTNAKEVDQRHADDWDDLDYADEYEVLSQSSHSRNNRVALNTAARLSITYNWDRYFINANGQFNNYNFKHRAMHGHLNDWYIHASFGVRL
jgi:hypothetical protein